jgi:hypothetical protein
MGGIKHLTPPATAKEIIMKLNKFNKKELEKMGLVVGYVLTRIFQEEEHRNPTNEEQQKISQKGLKYLLELLDKQN